MIILLYENIQSIQILGVQKSIFDLYDMLQRNDFKINRRNNLVTTVTWNRQSLKSNPLCIHIVLNSIVNSIVCIVMLCQRWNMDLIRRELLLVCLNVFDKEMVYMYSNHFDGAINVLQHLSKKVRMIQYFKK